MKLVIVGGVAGGASAAARARRMDEHAEIVLIERGPEVSFANCGLPYYIGGDISERKKLLITTPERLHARFRLDVRTRSSVEAIDRTSKSVTVLETGTGRTYAERYDKLILAPGAAPIRPPIRGADLPGVFTLRNLQDADRLRELAEGGGAVVLVGAGFINIELAEAFTRRSVPTTLVEKADQILAPFDREMTAPMVRALLDKGVTLKLGTSIESIEPAGQERVVVLDSGERLTARGVVFGIGVRPENSLAIDAGLAVSPRGGIQVNEFLQTSDPDIYAVGDAIEVSDAVLGVATQAPLAGPANRQGRIAAGNAVGGRATYRGSQGTAVVGFYDRTAALTGASEKALLRSGREFRKVYVHPANHAGYYPGAEGMSLKLLFDPEGQVLGAQAVGGAGVDKRIDIMAVAIQAGMTVFDLEEMELAYAPQFGSAKDPINMAGFVAGGMLRGDHPQIDVQAAVELQAAGDGVLLDVRTPTEFSAGHWPGAINIPVDDLRERLEELPRDRQLIAYCQVGQRGYFAARILAQSGFTVRNVSGGFTTYKLWQAADA